MSDEADMARWAEEAERHGMAEKSSAMLKRQGREFCLDCGDRILEGRRFAMPSATRCAFCQSQFEGAFR